MSQETVQEQRRRRKRRLRKQHRQLYKILARYKYHHYRWIKTDDHGSFEEMYRKYRGKGYTFWCADIPPEFSSPEGTWFGYRLDGDKEHTKATLKKYGRHKAWIDSQFKFQGKPVILVFNADQSG